ncbi:NTP transferase domain-containing protein [Taibaiella koreensis]|uniref:NTP transferase domain-containing protein n=1 Tax=Taibaiella koreensis TaxID=1268548 RepID=UPI000E59A1E5|nr:NTP transferase domain-containing protein [Taibaiella koreensis]
MTDLSCLGVVVCGGRSSRMGQDKSLIAYHGLPQRYHMAGLLQPFCDQVLLSLNSRQQDHSGAFPILTDTDPYLDAGPVAALLSATAAFPGHSFLLFGCDYPLLEARELGRFVQMLRPEALAVAFYNEAAGLYEPLLAWYSAGAAVLMEQQYREGQRSLQHFLKSIAADRYIPLWADSIISVDDPQTAAQVMARIAQRKTG